LDQKIFNATGSRKRSSAQVRIKLGTGKIVVNDRDPLKYFFRQNLVTIAFEPLVEAKMNGRMDVVVKTEGGGLSGQAGAVRMGLARALTKYDPELRADLKDRGFLTRDAREVERKKYGQAKARKRFQFSKR
jgi:small subunit ribosomal protein S9